MAAIACFVSIFTLFMLVRRILIALKQYRSMQLIEAAERLLSMQEAEYAKSLELACQNFRVSSPFVSESLRRIHTLLEVRREELKHARMLVERGQCSKERDADLLAAAWNDEIGQRVRDIRKFFADFSVGITSLAA